MKKIFHMTSNLILLTLLNSSCLDSNKKENKFIIENKKNEYNNRISNVKKVLKNDFEFHNFKNTNIYIIQTKKCGACDSATLQKISNSIDSISKDYDIVFILSEFDYNIYRDIKKMMGEKNKKHQLLIDSKCALTTNGLSFMKNTNIIINKDTITKWYFF